MSNFDSCITIKSYRGINTGLLQIHAIFVISLHIFNFTLFKHGYGFLSNILKVRQHIDKYLENWYPCKYNEQINEAMEKFTSIDRIVGKASEKEKKEGIEFMESVFKNQNFNDKSLEKAEREKTPEELEIISLVNSATNEIRKKYGLEKLDIPQKNIHVIQKGFWIDYDEMDNDTVIRGYFESKYQRILLEERPSRLSFMKTLFHEMLHFKSYNSLQVENVSHSKVEPYRSGISGAKRDFSADYLKSINEAVTEELTKRFSKKLDDNPIFAEEIKEKKEALDANSTQIDGTPLPENTYDDFYYAKNSKFGLIDFEYTYKEERGALRLLIDKLFERNKERFDNREEIFEIFAKGFMTGNILPMGKLIDKTFGKGTLRKIGDNNRNTYEIVNSL